MNDLGLWFLNTLLSKMPITPTNQSKSTTSPVGTNKYGIAAWGDSSYTWGDAIATWGSSGVSATNQSKAISSGLQIDAGQPMGLLLTLTYPSTFTIGSGWINSNKN